MYYCRFRSIWRYIKGRRQIVFVTLGGILFAKVLPATPSPLAAFTERPSIMVHWKPVQANTVSMWHLIFFGYFFNHRANTNLNLKSFFSLSWGRFMNRGTSKIVFFSAVFIALNENMVSQFRWFDTWADLRDDIVTCVPKVGRKYEVVYQLFYCFFKLPHKIASLL